MIRCLRHVASRPEPRRRPAFGVAAATLLLLALPAAAQVVQLRTGETLVGRVEDPTEDGLVFHRLDNGGVLDLRWDHLSAASSGRLKALYSLSVDDESEVTVPAASIRYEIPGGGVESVVGRIVAETERIVTVRRQGVPFPIPRSNIRGHKSVEVPASEVYTSEEFYGLKLAEFAPGDDADKHILFADLLVRARDYERAGEHLQKAKELGNSKQPNIIEGKLKRLRLFKEAAAEHELLDQIRAWIARRDFEKGGEALADFEERFPKGKLAAEFARVKQRFAKERGRHLVGQVTHLWFKTILSVARSKATDPTVTLDEAKEYAEERMGQDIRARVQKLLNLDAEELEEVWADRFEHRGGPRPERYHYGIGSWVLGKEAIIKDTKVSKGESQEAQSREDVARERRVRKIREALERARRSIARQSGGAGGGDQTPEEWWDRAPAEMRLNWLRAYYAEHGGDLKIYNAYLDGCVQCGAEGRLRHLGSSGKEEMVPCSACRGTQFKRWIRAH
ncbi:MAG: hypothetical protein AAF628_01810 [Planctomycetota bacterium]